MKVYIDKSDLTQVLDVVSRGEKEVYVLIDNTGKNENALHFLDLSDHDKQIRKEVVQEIRKQVVKLIEKDFKLCNHEYANGYCFGLQYDLAKILDQIEGGENGKTD